MRLSTRSYYALRAVRHIANLDKGCLGSISSVAEAEKLPRQFLAKILMKLTRGGILVAILGARGGYRLAKPYREITFLDVIEAIDGPLHLNQCTVGPASKANQINNGQMHLFWKTQEDAFKKALSKQHFGKHRQKGQRSR